MALPIAQFRNWVIGQLVKAADMLAVQTKVRELVGMAAYSMTGQTAFLPAANGVTVVPGTGMNVTIGGLDQFVFLPDTNTGSVAKPAYSTGAVTQAINAADPSQQRNDLICVQFNTPNVNGSNGSVLNNGVVSSQTVYDQDETFSIDYVAGTPGAGDPAVPSGWTALARVRVAAASTSIPSGNIDILLATTSSIIGGAVRGTISAGTGISVTGTPAAYTISNTGVTHLNNQNGDVVIQAAAGSPITVTTTTGLIQIGSSSGTTAQVPYRVTKLQGGGYAYPGNGNDFGHELSPNGGIRVCADTVDGAPFSIGFRTILTCTAAMPVAFYGCGVPTFDVYVDGAHQGSFAGTFNGLGVTIPAGQHTIDIVYSAANMAGPYYLGSQGGPNNYGGNATCFGWIPLTNGEITSNITAMQPG